MASPRAVLALVLLGACQFEPAGVGRIGIDGAGVEDGPGDASAPPDAAECGQAAAPRDDFEDGILCNGWADATQNHALVRERAGELVVLPEANMISVGGCITDLGVAVSLADGAVFVEVPTPSIEESTWATLKIYLLDAGGYPPMAIKQQGTAIQVLKNNVPLLSVAFNAGLMRWWRIRTDGPATHFETSPDGVSWNVAYTDLSEPQPHDVRVELLAGTWKSEPTPEEVHFDNFNVCP